MNAWTKRAIGVASLAGGLLALGAGSAGAKEASAGAAVRVGSAPTAKVRLCGGAALSGLLGRCGAQARPRAGTTVRAGGDVAVRVRDVASARVRLGARQARPRATAPDRPWATINGRATVAPRARLTSRVAAGLAADPALRARVATRAGVPSRLRASLAAQPVDAAAAVDLTTDPASADAVVTVGPGAALAPSAADLAVAVGLAGLMPASADGAIAVGSDGTATAAEASLILGPASPTRRRPPPTRPLPWASASAKGHRPPRTRRSPWGSASMTGHRRCRPSRTSRRCRGPSPATACWVMSPGSASTWTTSSRRPSASVAGRTPAPAARPRRPREHPGPARPAPAASCPARPRPPPRDWHRSARPCRPGPAAPCRSPATHSTCWRSWPWRCWRPVGCSCGPSGPLPLGRKEVTASPAESRRGGGRQHALMVTGR